LGEDLHSRNKLSNTSPAIKTMSFTLDTFTLDHTPLDSSTWNPTTFTQLKMTNHTCRLKENKATKGIKMNSNQTQSLNYPSLSHIPCLPNMKKSPSPNTLTNQKSLSKDTFLQNNNGIPVSVSKMLRKFMRK
jgi:hypothetical protein